MEQYRLKQWYPSLANSWRTKDAYEYDTNNEVMTNISNVKNGLAIPKQVIIKKAELHPDFWELIEDEKPKPLFITEDGVEVFLGHSYILIDKEFIKHKQTASNIVYTEYFKKFKHESNADKYILWNKPLLSLQEIDDTIEMYTHEFVELIKLAEKRIES